MCQPVTANAQLSGDPSNTRQIREAFVRDVQRRVRDLRGRIRRTVGYETDALHLAQDAPGATLTPNQDRFEFLTEEQRSDEFRRWLKEQIDEALQDPATRAEILSGAHWTARYIEDGYLKGWTQAEGLLMREGISISGTTAEIGAVIQAPAAEQTLQELYTRAYDNLDDISEDMARSIRQELRQGVAEGVNPRVMADRMNEELDSLSKTRLNTLARTETMNAHSSAMLDRYEQAGVDRVIHGEWSTAGDSRVCPICQSLEGRTFTIQRMREGTFQFDAAGEGVADSFAGSYRLKPPAHPNGRCTIIPVTQ